MTPKHIVAEALNAAENAGTKFGLTRALQAEYILKALRDAGYVLAKYEIQGPNLTCYYLPVPPEKN